VGGRVRLFVRVGCRRNGRGRHHRRRAVDRRQGAHGWLPQLKHGVLNAAAEGSIRARAPRGRASGLGGTSSTSRSAACLLVRRTRSSCTLDARELASQEPLRPHGVHEERASLPERCLRDRGAGIALRRSRYTPRRDAGTQHPVVRTAHASQGVLEVAVDICRAARWLGRRVPRRSCGGSPARGTVPRPRRRVRCACRRRSRARAWL
jgi:hypothetical protein